MTDRPPASGLRRLGRLSMPFAPFTRARRADGRAPGGRRGVTRPALLDGYRFRLAAVAILKNEASYLEEWLCHHLAVGVEHFLLYDNGSQDDLDTLIRPYANHGIVTLVHFPLRGGQRDANNHAVRFLGGAAEWLAFVDIDEFLVPRTDEGVPDILARFPEAQQILVARREFCFGGHRERPPGLVTEEYRLASEDVPRVSGSNVMAKPIVRSRGVTRMGVHAATTVDGATVDVCGRPVPEGKPLAAPVFEPLQVNHYYTKSWAEFEAKRARTSTSTHAFPLPAVPFDIPAVPDEAADRWVPRTRERMVEMRALAPNPYRYGSRLRLEGFPRNDQFTVQAAAVVANELAGLAEPHKQRAFDLPKLALGRGAVGHARGAAHSYVPALGRFLGSVHVRQELAWLEAAVDWAVGEAWPPELAVSTGTVAREDEPMRWSLVPSSVDEAVRVEAPVRDDGLRCHALLLAVAVGEPVRLTVEVRAAGARSRADWELVAAADLAHAGTWLGLLACDEDPRALAGLRVSLPGAADVYDLALVRYG